MDRISISDKQQFISLGPQTTMRFLPQSYPFIMLDRIKACYPEKGVGIALKHITMTDPVLSGHFPGFPIYPGVMVIEAMVQNAGMTMTLCALYRQYGSLEGLLAQLRRPGALTGCEGKQYVLAESRIKHIAPIYPGCALELEAAMALARDGMYVFKVSARADGVEVAKGQLTMSELPPDMSLGLQDRIGYA